MLRADSWDALDAADPPTVRDAGLTCASIERPRQDSNL